MNWFQRWAMMLRHKYTLRTLRRHSVEVEQFLLDIANRKRQVVLGPEDLRSIALYLGDPDRAKPECMK